MDKERAIRSKLCGGWKCTFLTGVSSTYWARGEGQERMGCVKIPQWLSTKQHTTHGILAISNFNVHLFLLLYAPLHI